MRVHETNLHHRAPAIRGIVGMESTTYGGTLGAYAAASETLTKPALLANINSMQAG